MRISPLQQEIPGLEDVGFAPGALDPVDHEVERGYSIRTFPAAAITMKHDGNDIITEPESPTSIKFFMTAVSRDGVPKAGFTISASVAHIAAIRKLHNEVVEAIGHNEGLKTQDMRMTLKSVVEDYCRSHRLKLVSASWREAQ